MDEPFYTLQRSLLPMFQFEAMRNGKYSFPAVQHLKDTIDNYNHRNKQSFLDMLKAMKEALPYIEKWRLNFGKIRLSMDSLAKLHSLPAIDWNKLLSHPKVSHRFQFSALSHAHQEKDLASWISHKLGKSFNELGEATLTKTLLEFRDKVGFSQRLSQHLKNDPDFLLNLVLHSEKNFIRILNTRLIFFLTDEQLATAIVHHLPEISRHRKVNLERPNGIVHVLNGILSNGLSVSTLMRNTKAKAILEHSGLVKSGPNHPASREDKGQEEPAKPGL